MNSNWVCWNHAAIGEDNESLKRHLHSWKIRTCSVALRSLNEFSVFGDDQTAQEQTRAERAEHRCLELSREVGELKREISMHSCKPPLGNPTREEAIAQRDEARETLHFLREASQSIIGILKGGV